VELLNPQLDEPLPCYLPPHGGSEPLWLMTAPAVGLLNSTFCERDELRRREGGMVLKLNRDDARMRGIGNGDPVLAANERGEVLFSARIDDGVPPGLVVAEGVWWLEFAPGARGVNALTSQRLTDRGAGSTFYDTTVDVRRAE
jgi:anaerobic selenocysteine-containing dehydrogenase